MLERGCITIKDLVIMAKHGCTDEAKKFEQPFHFDVKVFSDCAKAAVADDLDNTVSLIDVYDFMNDFVVSHCFDIMEKLAIEVARGLMDKFSVIDEVQIAVRKNPYPYVHKIEGFGCEFTVKREIAYLSLGSSLGDRENYLNQAVEHLRKVRGINVLKVSEFIDTDPYGGAATQNTFLNGAVKISTYLEPEELFNHLLSIEQMLGRTREAGVWGTDRTCDIDIIFFGDKKIRTERLIIPHYDWHNRDFVKIPLKQINPDFDF